MIIAIDFDGTIVEHKYPAIGRLQPGAKQIITRLSRAGHKIMIWTCRYLDEDIKSMVRFLCDNEIPYNYINENDVELSFQPDKKKYADIYIDDHNLFHKDNWSDIENELERNGVLKREDI